MVVTRVDGEARSHRVRELRDEVLAPELEWVHAELARERVHRALEHVRRLRSAGSAVGVRRCGVREGARERDAVVGDLVRPRVDPRTEERNAGSHELQVRAHGAPGFRPDRRDVAVLRRRERELVHDIAAVDGSHVVFGPLLRPLHRAAQTACERDRERALAVDLELRAEASAHVGRDHADLRLGDAEHELESEARDVRCLRRRPESDLAGGPDLREHATGLDRVRDEPRLVVAPRHDDVGGVDRCLDVAGLELPDVALVRAELLVHEGGSVCQRLLDVGVRRKRLVIDLDELRCILCERAARGDDDRHGIALVARLANRERIVRRRLDVFCHRPGARQAALPVLREVGTRERRDDALRSAGRLEVHTRDARAWVRAADDDHVRHRRQCHVVDEGSLSAQERRVLLALDGGSDEARCDLGRAHDATPATDATAWTMLWYPVQRQRLPSRPSRIAASSVAPPLSMRLTAARTIPGVQ